MVTRNKKLLADDAMIVLSDENSSADEADGQDLLGRSTPA